LALGPAILDRRVAALDEASFLQASAEACDEMRGRTRQCCVEKPYHRHGLLLRAYGKRPSDYTAAKKVR
jgi:hypothetical protein